VVRGEFLRLEKRIAAGERGGVVERWRYGRRLLDAKAGRQRLPKGFIGDRVAEADRAGLRLTAREIQYRITLAEAYPTETHTRTAVRLFGSWTALREAGFPPVVVDESDLEPDEVEEAVSAAAPDEFEQLSLIPGLGPVIKAGVRRVPLDEATIADVRAYRDMYAQIHDNYGKRLALIEAALAAMAAGSGGDDAANAVQAWQRGVTR
jgi:hypothetical protein